MSVSVKQFLQPVAESAAKHGSMSSRGAGDRNLRATHWLVSTGLPNVRKVCRLRPVPLATGHFAANRSAAQFDVCIGIFAGRVRLVDKRHVREHLMHQTIFLNATAKKQCQLFWSSKTAASNERPSLRLNTVRQPLFSLQVDAAQQRQGQSIQERCNTKNQHQQSPEVTALQRRPHRPGSRPSNAGCTAGF